MKIIIVALFVFPMIAFAGPAPAPKCSNLGEAKNALKDAKRELLDAENILKTSVLKSDDKAIASLVTDYGNCESLDLKVLRGVSNQDLMAAISKVSSDKDAAARCYYSVMLHIDYAEHPHPEAVEFCLTDDTPVSAAQARKFASAKYFNGGTGGTLTNQAKYTDCRRDMKAMATAYDHVQEASKAVKQDLAACKKMMQDQPSSTSDQPQTTGGQP